MDIQKIKDFYQKHKVKIGIISLLSFFFLGLTILVFDNNGLRRSEKAAKKEIENLHKQNKDLLKEKQALLDSAEILHKIAINLNSDTIYIKSVKYFNKKTNEEITHFNTLDRDSKYLVFSGLVEEYTKTGFDKDSL